MSGQNTGSGLENIEKRQDDAQRKGKDVKNQHKALHESSVLPCLSLKNVHDRTHQPLKGLAVHRHQLAMQNTMSMFEKRRAQFEHVYLS